MNPLSHTAPRLTWLAGAFVVSFCGLLASIGAGAHWLAALGREIAQLGDIPAGIPYAAAPSVGWENAPVLGELAFHGLEVALGDRGTGARACRRRRAGHRDAGARHAPRGRGRRSFCARATAGRSGRGPVAADRPRSAFLAGALPRTLADSAQQARLPSEAVWLLARSLLSGRTSTGACSWASPWPARTCSCTGYGGRR